MATSGKGLPFIGKMNEFLDRILHPTVNKTGHSSAALDVTGRSFFAVNDILTPLVVEAGSDNNILVHTGLNAIAGDVIRIMSSANGIKEFEIVVHEAPDANTAILAGYLSADLAAGDTFNHLRAVRELSSADGASLATVISPPIQIIKNGTVQTVEDSLTPADVVAIPVKIMAADGTNITITAGDINVQNSAEGVNFDSIRLGDGTAKYASITANLELSVHDADALVELEAINISTDSIDTKTPSLGQATMAASTPVTIASDQTAVKIAPEGRLSTVNSTSVNLGAGATFTGTGEDVINIGDISIGIVSSHNSAAGGLKFEFSPDNISWYESDAYTYSTLNGIAVYSLAPMMRYFRIRYINGATLTTTLHIQVVYRPFYTKASSHRLEDFVNADNDAELVKAVLAAKKPDDTWTNIESTAGGNLKVSVEEFDNPLPTGTNTIGKVDQGLGGASAWLVSAATLPLPTGASTSALQTTGNTSLSNIDTSIGARADASATTDTGTFSIIALIKRGLENWTTFQAKMPVLGQAVKTASIPVVLASNSDALNVVNSNATGSIQKGTLSAGGSTTAIAPANATGCFIKNQSASVGEAIYWEIGGTASTSSNDLVAGQGTAFIPCSGTVSLLASADGTANYSVQWLIK